MESKELRIGNWVHHKATWSYRNEDIKEFNFQWDAGDWYCVGECTMDLESIEPIPLTGKLLKKCGYEKVNTLVNMVDVWQKNECQMIYFLHGIARYSSASSMAYLHELQNAHKVFHVNELEIDL